jgi:outer membrane receptor protein involved in Fe transport
VAPSGTAAAFVDLMNVPLSAVERIEVFGDGASAVYGADAVGGVINLIMRKRASLAESFLEIGSGTDGTQHEGRIGGTWGREEGERGLLLSAEVFYRDALSGYRRAQATSDLTPWGPNLGTPYSNPGTLVTRTRSYGLPSGPLSLPIDVSTLPAQANLSDVDANADVLPNQRRRSLYASAHHTLFENVDAFVQGLWTKRDASQQQGDSRAAVPIPNDETFFSNVPPGPAPLQLDCDLKALFGTEDLTATVTTFNVSTGLEADLAAHWHLSTVVSNSLEKQSQRILGRADPSALGAALTGSTDRAGFDPFNGTQASASTKDWLAQPRFAMHSELWQWHVDADGPLWDLPAGAMKLAVGSEYRNQLFRSGATEGPGLTVYSYDWGRRLYALYGELRIPLLGAGATLSGVHSLEVSLQGRYEDYSDFGSSLTPRFAVFYEPNDAWLVRATYARSTRAPNLGDLYQGQNGSFIAVVPAPGGAGAMTHVLAWSGGNSSLEPERARSFTAGVQFQPPQVANFKWTVDYFNTLYDHRIQTTGIDGSQIVSDLLSNPAYRDILEAPTVDARNRVCEHSLFGTAGASCTDTAVAAIVDLRSLNIASLRVSGLDSSIHSSMAAGPGSLYGELSGVYLLKYSQRPTPDAPEQNLLNTPNNPINLRAVGTLGWRGRQWDAHWSAYYAHGYHDFVSQPQRDIASWTTFDAGLRYTTASDQPRGLGGIVVELNVQNLFDRYPPRVVDRPEQQGFDPGDAEITGRTVRLEITKNW